MIMMMIITSEWKEVKVNHSNNRKVLKMIKIIFLILKFLLSKKFLYMNLLLRILMMIILREKTVKLIFRIFKIHLMHHLIDLNNHLETYRIKALTRVMIGVLERKTKEILDSKYLHKGVKRFSTLIQLIISNIERLCSMLILINIKQLWIRKKNNLL